MDTQAAAQTQPIINDDATLIYLPMHGIVAMAHEPAKQPTTPVEILHQHKQHVPWGDDDDYPAYVEEEAHKNDLIPAVLQFKANAMAAAGIECGIISSYDKFGKPVYERVDHAGVDEFWFNNNKQLFLEDGYRNLFWWQYGFASLLLNDEKTYIASVSFEDTAHCRFNPQNTRTGNKDWVYIDANFPRNTQDTTLKVRCLDPYFDRLGQLQKIAGTHFLYPVFFNSPKKNYFQRVPWHSLLDSKWLSLSQKIVEFKEKLLQKQMSIRYVVYVPSSYWEETFKNWKTLSAAEQESLRRSKITEFNNALTGVTNAGKTIMLTFKVDNYGKEFGKWEIKEMSGVLAQGAFIEDTQECSEHILFALAFDGTLIGKTPGKGMGSGSGSDKRLADEIFYKNNKAFALKLIEILDFISVVNKWKHNGKLLKWFMPETILTTLNNVNPDNRP